MSSGGGPSARFDRVRDVPYYDEVPLGSLRREDDPRALGELRGAELALSSDPLPPPPLPDVPPVGPEFYPSDSEDNLDALDIKPVRRFIPDSVKNFFRGGSGGGSGGGGGSDGSSDAKPWAMLHPENNGTSQGVRCSPPHSPSVPGSYRDPYGGSGGSYNSRKEREAMLLGLDPLESIDGRTVQTVLTYSERVEAYNERYAYMKSWAGLLRILGCIELLLGAAVFACVCAYIHKDNEWFNMYGYSQPQMYGGYGGQGMAGVGGGAYYTGPKTPFILVVAGLAWVVTVILLVMGMTMYYRTILLDSNWWPLTEFIINLALALLFMAAGIVYVRDTNRGGLCSYPVFNNGINGAFCRVEAGQTAAIIFLFVTMLVYLIGAIVCLKLWRHEAARRLREGMALEMKTTASSVPRSLLIGSSNGPVESVRAIPVQAPPSVVMPPEILSGHIPSGHIPKPVIMPDYVAKYPTIRTDEERDQYKAVFNDQYAEYKELHAEVQAMVKKFDEMDGLMRSLPTHPTSQMEQDRINFLMQEYQRKKMDPTFVEKRERCEYLKNKLSHIKQKIQEYNKVMDWNDGYSLDGLGTRSDRYD
ncbi:MARVEL domain-containing protein 2b [Anguilla anguilla]|uniref:MARVEL domain-containing protein 2b n=1 Tax=Anguilla anguilla TaxID=7936 RepID=UPI0015AC9CE7|nr:MARVEL domain-containing protein 2b [Anguilla anguilla]XP_035235989.1 MARVEL domain-containing protein 2b [Anguilla anguilla]XP_035235990.1 MARVEL domain-containing protein 2b [Anguilla anguilla]XP_035235991.1 MARVEL domain-containing protein 2b [Anguilla anguilla]